ncbi:MAG: nucleoside kinase [Clostridia bacterium]|nr:nucleoside kinase [Clostridia bacterium]
MKLDLDGKVVELESGKTILDGVRKGGLDSISLADRPLAAQIGGEVFSLSYTPNKDTKMQLLRYGDEMGRRVYERTLQFVFIVAVRKLYPSARVRVRYSLGSGLFITLEDPDNAFTQEATSHIETEMRLLVRKGLPLERKRISIKEAVDFFEKDGQKDKADLLKWRKFSYFDVYQAEGHMDYFYGEMTPDTSYVDVFRIKHIWDGAVMLMMPRKDAPDVLADCPELPKLHELVHQSDEWGRLMKCDTVHQLNSAVESGSIRELVRINEALHERRYSDLADKIIASGAKAVMLAGPSSSGKTTSAHRLATQLRLHGQEPVMLSLDDYYIDRDKILPDENGEVDLENINTLDIPRFKADLAALVRGEEVEVPEFDFKTGRRSSESRTLKLTEDQPVIIEGIHGLNPQLIEGVDESKIFRVYVSALTTLNLDDHNRIRTTDIRILRRLVRDYKTRNASMEETLGMWASVRRGEERWIFPYQENADVLLNTALLYEVSVLKKYVYPLLNEVKPQSKYYAMAKDIVKFLNYILDADIEDEIPPTSVIREFIGGNTYYRK